MSELKEKDFMISHGTVIHTAEEAENCKVCKKVMAEGQIMIDILTDYRKFLYRHLLKRLPKERDGYLSIHSERIFKLQDEGFNQALSEVRKIIERELGE